MKDSTRAAIELSMGVIIFATLVYVFVSLFLAGSGALTNPPMPFNGSNFSFVNTTVCDATNPFCPCIPFVGCFCIPVLSTLSNWECYVATFIGWLISTIVQLFLFVVAFALWFADFGAKVFLFAWIWFGSPLFCSGSACVIQPLPPPINFLIGIPLTAFGAFMIIDLVMYMLQLFPLWGKK